ncbi:MAG: rhomboid family intramembrane serine protease, partial [Myxococcota bacterium]
MTATRIQSTVGRGSAHAVPWVTFAVIGLCVVLHGLTNVAANEAQATAELELQHAIEYLNAHTYLDPGPVLAERIEQSFLEQKRAIERAARIRRGAPPIPKRVQQRQQVELDRLVTEAFAGMSELPAQRWGFRASEFDPLTLVTHSYFHGGSLHLMPTLFLFLILGFQLETAWGSAVFLGVLLSSSVASAAVYAAGNTDYHAPLIGMSGVLSALVAAFAVRFRSLWKQPVYSFLLVIVPVYLIVPVRWGSEWSIAGGIEQASVLVGHQGASYWAFGGGAAFGLVAALAIAFFSAIASDGDDPSGSKTKFQASPGLEKALKAQAAGRLGEAYGVLAELIQKTPVEHEALLVMWDVGLDHGRPAEASAAMLRAIREEVKRNDPAAVEHWLDLTSRGLQADAEPVLLLRIALMLQKKGQPFVAVAALKQALIKSEGGDTAAVAARVARVSRDLDHDTARDAAWQALGSADLSLEERQDLEAMLGEIGSGIGLSVIGEATPGRAVEVDLGEEPTGEAFDTGAKSSGIEIEPWVDPNLVDDGAGKEAATVELDQLVERRDVYVPPAPSDSSFQRTDAIDLQLESRTIRSVTVAPLALEPAGLLVELAGGMKKRVQAQKIEAIAVAAVDGLGQKSVILIDLVMNWHSGADEPLKVIRLPGPQSRVMFG